MASEMNQRIKADLLNDAKKCLNDCRTFLTQIFTPLAACDEPVDIRFSDDKPVEILLLREEDIQKWADNIREGLPHRFAKVREWPCEELPEDIREALRRELDSRREERLRDDWDNFSRPISGGNAGNAINGANPSKQNSEKQFSWPCVIKGAYEAFPQPIITIYYRNFSSFDAWSSHEDDNGLKERFMAEIFAAIAHEFFHHVHHHFLEGKGLFGSCSWEKDVVSESLAEFFSYMFLGGFPDDFCRGKNSGYQYVTEKMYHSWELYYGSPWPYAYALLYLISRGRKPVTRFLQVFCESFFGWRKAYNLLMKDNPMKPFKNVRKSYSGKNEKKKKVWDELVFVEFGPKKAETTTVRDFQIPPDAFSLLARIPSKDIHNVRDVTDLIDGGLYHFDTPYLALFFYDSEDEMSRKFIGIYGGSLHNKSSWNVTILTFFDVETVDKWSNVQRKDKIQIRNNFSQVHDDRALNILKNQFNVKSLPTLVLIDGKHDNPPLTIPLQPGDPQSLNGFFVSFFKIIDDNPDDAFPAIMRGLSEVQSGRKLLNSAVKKNSFYKYFGDLCSEKGVKLKDVQEALDVSSKTLYNKRADASSTREECLKLANILDLNEGEIKELMQYHDYRDVSLKEWNDILEKRVLNRDILMKE